MKKIWILGIVLLIIILPIAYYFISPLWNVIEVQEESPLDKIKTQDNVDILSEPERDKANEEVLTKAEQMEKGMINEKVMVMDDDMPKTTQKLSQGTFNPKAHEVKGKALIIQDGDSNILRFENFDTINGPNLHIFLASSLDNKDSIDLGEIKATKGNVNYDIPKGVDLNKYDKVLVWCVPFKVLFSYAELN